MKTVTYLRLALLTPFLVWGYICVGVGFGIYKILPRRGFIRDEAIPPSMPLPEPS